MLDLQAVVAEADYGIGDFFFMAVIVLAMGIPGALFAFNPMGIWEVKQEFEMKGKAEPSDFWLWSTKAAGWTLMLGGVGAAIYVGLGVGIFKLPWLLVRGHVVVDTIMRPRRRITAKNLIIVLSALLTERGADAGLAATA